MRNKLLILLIVTFILGLHIGCSKKISTVDNPSDFNVMVNSTTYKVNDTVTFNLSGNPDEIVFYTGEPGRQYQNRNRYMAVGVNKLSFSSYMQQGTSKLPDSSLKLFITTNLGGRYDSTGIANATWNDITNLAKWPDSIGTTYTNSGLIDITNYNSFDSVNIAFNYKGNLDSKNTQRKWSIQNFNLVNILPDSSAWGLFTNPFLGTATGVESSTSFPTTTNPSTFAATGWVEMDMLNNKNAWNVGTWNISTTDSVRNSSGVTITNKYPIFFDPGNKPNIPNNNDWLITSVVNLKHVYPDVGAVVKNTITPSLSNYQYVFVKPGVYTVTFVASNINVNTSKSVVRQVTITVK